MKEEKQIKRLTIILIIGLFISGLTAIPLELETFFLFIFFGDIDWIKQVIETIQVANRNFPSAFYATDWLAFAHFTLAYLYVGFYKNPNKNDWLINFGITISIAVIPFAFIFGEIRFIPIWWRLIDCSFGIVALLIFLRIKSLVKNINSKP